MTSTTEITSAIVQEAATFLGKGTEHTVHSFEHEKRPFVIKEFTGRNKDVIQKYTVQELAVYLNKIYGIVKKHIKEVQPTYFFVAPNQSGNEAIFLVQNKIKGKAVQDMTTLNKLGLKWTMKVMKDPEWNSIPKDIKDEFVESDFYGKNVVKTEDGAVSIIDW